jgi:hypothetical protein
MEAKELEPQSADDQERGENIEPGEAVPDFLERSADGCHRAVNENNTLPEIGRRKAAQALIGEKTGRP